MKEPILEIKGIPVVLILGSALVLSDAYYIVLETIQSTVLLESALVVTSYTLLLLVGLWLVLHREMSIHKCIYLCGMALGIASILQNLMSVGAENDEADVLLGFLSILLGIAEMAFSIAYLFGYRRYVVKICAAVLVQIGMILLPIFVAWYVATTWEEIAIDYSMCFPLLFVNVVFAWILTRKGIWFPFPTKRIENNLIALEPILHSDKDRYLTPSSLELLLDCDRWTVCSGGPVEKEVMVELLGDEHGVRVLIQKLVGDPVPHGRVIPFSQGQFMQAHHFDVVQMVVSEARDNLRIYGNDGVFINIQVREPPEEKPDLPTRFQRLFFKKKEVEEGSDGPIIP